MIILAQFALMLGVGLNVPMFLPSGTSNGETETLEEFWEKMENLEVITATKQLEAYSRAPNTLYIITKEEIRLFGYRFLQEALAHIPSVHLYNPHSWIWGGQRGFVSNFSQTLLLLNGREMNNLIAGEGFISHQFSLHNVERIEVLAGPGSALYGANALAGIINIITMDEGEDGTSVSAGLEAGSNGNQAIDATLDQQWGDWRLRASLRHFETQGEDFTDFVNSDLFTHGWVDAPYAANNKGGYENEGKGKPFEWDLSYKNIYVGMAGYTNIQGQGQEKLLWDYQDAFDERHLHVFYAGVDTQINERWKLKIEANRTESTFWGKYKAGLWPVARLEASADVSIFTLPDEITTSEGIHLVGDEAIRSYYPSFASFLIDQGYLDPQNISQAEIDRYFSHIYSNKQSPGSSRTRFETQVRWQASATTQFLFGSLLERLDYAGLAVTDGANGIGGTVNVPFDRALRKDVYESEKIGIYTQLRQELIHDQMWLTAGARYDRQEHYGGSFNPRIAWVWEPLLHTIIKASYGEAFREPNVFELAGNPDLEPADLSSYELSFARVIHPWGKLFISAYRNRVANFIGSVGDLIGSGIGEVEAQETNGVEMQVRFKLGSTLGFINGGSILDAKQDLRTESAVLKESLMGISDLQLNAGVSQGLGSWFTASIAYKYVQGYEALSGNRSNQNPIFIDDAHHLRFNFALQPLKLGEVTLEGFITVDNLGDERNYQANIRRSGPQVFLQDGRRFDLRLRFSY